MALELFQGAAAVRAVQGLNLLQGILQATKLDLVGLTLLSSNTANGDVPSGTCHVAKRVALVLAVLQGLAVLGLEKGIDLQQTVLQVADSLASPRGRCRWISALTFRCGRCRWAPFLVRELHDLQNLAFQEDDKHEKEK